MKELNERAVKAAKRYLEMKGMSVIDESWSKDDLAGKIDLIADDEGELIFATVTVSTTGDGGFREQPLSREQAELLAASWLAEHPSETDLAIRFDCVAIMACSEDRAILRHHINCFGFPGAAF